MRLLLLITVGLILTNLLTFSRSFSVCVAGLCQFILLLEGTMEFRLASLWSAIILVMTFVLIYATTGYNQLETFCWHHLRKPGWFRLFHQPLVLSWLGWKISAKYSCFCPSVFGSLFSKKQGQESLMNKTYQCSVFSAVASLSAMLLAGAWSKLELLKAASSIGAIFSYVTQKI